MIILIYLFIALLVSPYVFAFVLIVLGKILGEIESLLPKTKPIEIVENKTYLGKK